MKNKRIAKVLHDAAKGYGMSEREILTVLNRIPHEMVNDFLYTMYRIAEKSGDEAFSDAEYESRV